MLSELFSQLFENPESWLVVASGHAEGKLSRVEGANGKAAMRLDYDFHEGGGFVVARKEVRFALPETFEIGLSMCGESPANHFEFKLADPGGSNAWRYLHQDLVFPAAWENFKIRERDLPFAWGPAGGGAPTLVGAVELVIAAGPGGKGSVMFSDLTVVDQTLYLPESIHASSHRPNNPPEAVFESAAPSGWYALDDDAEPEWVVDFGRSVRFGGIVLTWPSAMPPRNYAIEISEDGATWQEIYQASHALGVRSYIPAPQAEARQLKVKFRNPESAALVALSLKPDAFSHTPNEFIHAVAAEYPRGWFPRYWHREQSYWTPIGTPEGRRRALINEEGLVEVDEAAFSLEPFLLVGERLVTWSDVEISLCLPEDGTPFPVVTWKLEGLKLHILPWVEGRGENLVLRVTYHVESELAQPVRLAVTARPFQVNPPWQAFRDLGGRSAIREISCGAGGMQIDHRRVNAEFPPDASGAAKFEEGGVMDYLAAGTVPPSATIDDKSGLASGVLLWNLPEGSASFQVTISVPFFENAGLCADNARDSAIAHWRDVLAPVEWHVPDVACEAIRCFRTAASHILINRDGAAFQPGPRRYTRSWVRDCVIMGSAMAKAHVPNVLHEFLRWYVQFQREDGHVPCVVDRDGVDSLVEHDSHGQLIWGICEVFRAEGDRDFLETLWQPVVLAAEYLMRLRQERMTDDYRTPERIDCYGLLPESASHEGYLAHPVHSYWDDFWGVRGLEAAAEIAVAMDDRVSASRWRDEARKFLEDVRASLDRVIAENALKYIPGSVEWADFDPTATANAIAQLDFADDLPQGPLHQMLDTYMEGFRMKHRGEIPWLNYTAYEIRIIGAFVRLGRRDEANELLEFFLSDRRPIEWNQWPEITWRDPRSPGHLGDVPHTWIAAEYMLALISMVASERERTERMVLAAGLPWAWIVEEHGFSVRGLMTRFGKLDFQIRVTGADEITFDIADTISLPPGGLFVTPPLPPGERIISAVNFTGHSLILDPGGTTVTINALPITVTLSIGE